MASSDNSCAPRSAPPSWILRPSVAVTVLAALLIVVSRDYNLTLFYLRHQDIWLLATGTLLLMVCFWRLDRSSDPLIVSPRLALTIGMLMALGAWAGHYWILSGYDLSRDEQMATFDAAVFAEGRIVAPLSGIWRDHADALNTMFMYPAERPGAWISSYLPFNAAFRALFAQLGDAALTGPAMTLMGAVALWGCARRIWPDNREAPAVALLLYLGSGQILLSGMTTYAMPGHLALNLCWLWLFLNRKLWADMAALLVGFVAVGLHQPIMHPMFAAPILFLLILERDWRRASLYFAGYAVIGAFWLWWPGMIWSLVETGAAARPAEGVDYLSRLLVTIEKGDDLRFSNMAANLFRFLSWQHLLLLPLLFLGIGRVLRSRLAAALLVGLVLTILVMTVILPYQGHGFGYRYLHGLIGNAILLAVFGWVALGERCNRWRPLMTRATLAGLVVLLPMQLWMAYAFYRPPMQISARLSASDVDYVVVGGGDAPFASDFVLNPPDVDRRPVRLLREKIDISLARALCGGRGDRFFALADQNVLRPAADFYGLSAVPSADLANAEIAALLILSGCEARPIG